MKVKYHILVLCESYGGGVKRQVDYLNKYINKDLFVLTTLASSKRGANVSTDYFLDDRMSSFPKNICKFLKSVKTVHILVKRKKIDVIHAHSTIAGIIAILHKIIYFSKIPIVYTPHAYYSEISRGHIKDFILVHAEKVMNYFFSMNIHVSKEEEEYALKTGISSKLKSTVVNNGIPIRIIKPICDSSSKNLEFINVARCDYQKNPELFIKLAKIINDNIPNVNFTWVGDGPLLDKCIKQVNKMKLENTVHFVGYSDNPFRYLDSADIFISTSRYEGQPFSVIEAMSDGLPLILTDIVGHKELIKENGKLITKNEISDKESLISLVEDVIKNKDRESEHSLRIFRKNYNVKDMVEGIESVYKKMI